MIYTTRLRQLSAEGLWRDPRGWTPEEFFKILSQTNLTSVPRSVGHDFGSFRLWVYRHSHSRGPRGRSLEDTVPTFKLFPQTRYFIGIVGGVLRF